MFSLSISCHYLYVWIVPSRYLALDLVIWNFVKSFHLCGVKHGFIQQITNSVLLQQLFVIYNYNSFFFYKSFCNPYSHLTFYKVFLCVRINMLLLWPMAYLFAWGYGIKPQQEGFLGYLMTVWSSSRWWPVLFRLSAWDMLCPIL